jgi:hypothetical protein
LEQRVILSASLGASSPSVAGAFAAFD